MAGAGSQYVDVTLEDMELFLKRAYRVFRPKRSVASNQVVFDLNVSDNKIFIRVHTGIRPHGGIRGIGQDSIKVTMPGLLKSQKIVKRTKNWRNSLQTRIDEVLEVYEEKPNYWKERAGLPTSDRPEDALEVEKTPPREKKKKDEIPTGTYSYLSRGGVGVNIEIKGKPGMIVMGVTRGGKKQRVILEERLKAGPSPYTSTKYQELWTIKDNSRRAGEDISEGEVTTSSKVAERYMQLRLV